ncbi:hypothetical protein P154DRAFT_155402 [Amniculicola lignicola CBS 123094]|uniref:Uncharacterized protein n=1 Tax=Amniculicola lignicola CBS 123094 TaxID=1392246 RepID=A0A6A5WJS4_9PLEO|nr:hypothetical protein P154DRAFT_155402 [Amniculicola lignicola CBS 123094]
MYGHSGKRTVPASPPRIDRRMQWLGGTGAPSGCPLNGEHNDTLKVNDILGAPYHKSSSALEAVDLMVKAKSNLQTTAIEQFFMIDEGRSCFSRPVSLETVVVLPIGSSPIFDCQPTIELKDTRGACAEPCEPWLSANQYPVFQHLHTSGS